MSIASKIWLFLLTMALSQSAGANGLGLVTLTTQLERADLVAVGRLGTATTCTSGSHQLPCAEILLGVTFKDNSELTGVRRFLILSVGVRELSVEDVRVPERALFFLRRIEFQNGHNPSGGAIYYLAVAARQSILPLDDTGLIFGSFRPN
jgi:hypothetical protein